MHLMTAEALQIYADKLKDDGIAVLHVSNRYLDLEQVLAATVPQVPGLKGVVVSDDNSDGSYASTTSTIVVVCQGREGARDLPRRSKEPRTWAPPTSSLGPMMTPTCLGRSCPSGASAADPRGCAAALWPL